MVWASTVSNNSLRVVTQKYISLCLTIV